MALPILQIERKFRELNRDFYKTDFVFYGVINTELWEQAFQSKLRVIILPADHADERRVINDISPV